MGALDKMTDTDLDRILLLAGRQQTANESLCEIMDDIFRRGYVTHEHIHKVRNIQQRVAAQRVSRRMARG